MSICAVPSRNRSLHSSEDAPKSLTPSVEGSKWVSNLPVALIVSPVAPPRSTLVLTTTRLVAESRTRLPEEVSIV